MPPSGPLSIRGHRVRSDRFNRCAGVRVDSIRLRLWAWLCVACFIAGFASCARATAWDMQWAAPTTNGVLFAGQWAAVWHGDDGASAALLACTHAGPPAGTNVTKTSSSTVSGQLVEAYDCKNSGGGVLYSYQARQFFNCPPTDGSTWFGTLSPGCTAPIDPCTVSPIAGAALTADLWYDYGTDPGNPNGQGLLPQVACHKPVTGQTYGCKVVFVGEFLDSSGAAYSALVGGVEHYFAKGHYQYLPGTDANAGKCTTDSDPVDGPTTKPNDTCKAGDIKTTKNGITVCLKPDGTETDPNDENNDGMPDSCHPGTWTTGDGWTVTESWDSGTRTCSQHGTKSGQPDKDQNVTPGNPGPFTNPTPTPGQPTQQPGTTDPKRTDTDAGEFCKKNPTALMCVKSTWGGSCGGGFTCTGDAVFCAIAKEEHQRNCTLFDTATTLSTLGNNVASGADPMQTAIDAALGKGGTPTALPGWTTTEIFTASCPDAIHASMQGFSLDFDLSQFCTIAGYLGYIFVMGCGIIGMMIVGRA